MLKDPPLLTIRRNFTRPDLARVDKLVGAQTGHMTDAMYGRGALDAAIKPVDAKAASFAGIALTCESFADDNLAIVAAINFARPGDVLICASDGFARTAVVGDNVTLMAKHAGIRAIVVDGMVRDLDGIEPVGIPVFSRGITPNSCVKNGPGKVGLPIVAGGVRIEPGDVVIGDRDGVVIVPQAQLDHILAHLDEIRRLEAEVQGRIKREKLITLDSMKALLASDKVSYLD